MADQEIQLIEKQSFVEASLSAKGEIQPRIRVIFEGNENLTATSNQVLAELKRMYQEWQTFKQPNP